MRSGRAMLPLPGEPGRAGVVSGFTQQNLPMKKLLLALLPVISTVLLLAGCDTFDSRATEKAQVFDNLSEKTQKRLERGTIHAGDTEDMVYIALGDPDEKRQITNNDGT